MSRHAVASALALVVVACAADPTELEEPDAAQLDAFGADAPTADALPSDSSVHAPSSDVSTSACSCSFGAEPRAPFVVASIALAGLAALRRRLWLVRRVRYAHDGRPSG